MKISLPNSNHKVFQIKYWNASGSDFPPSLIPAFRNIGILHYKKAKLRKHLQQSVLLGNVFLDKKGNAGRIFLLIRWKKSKPGT